MVRCGSVARCDAFSILIKIATKAIRTAQIKFNAYFGLFYKINALKIANLACAIQCFFLLLLNRQKFQYSKNWKLQLHAKCPLNKWSDFLWLLFAFIQTNFVLIVILLLLRLSIAIYGTYEGILIDLTIDCLKCVMCVCDNLITIEIVSVYRYDGIQ